MQLTIRVLGLELLAVEISTDDGDEDGPGDATSMPVGFNAVDGRWLPGEQFQ